MMSDTAMRADDNNLTDDGTQRETGNDATMAEDQEGVGVGGPNDATQVETPSHATQIEVPQDATQVEIAHGGAQGNRQSYGAAQGSEAPRRRRLSLPVGITGAYDYVHDLPASGSEADIALLRDRSTNEQYILKFYKQGLSPDPIAMRLLRTADPRYVVRLIDFHDEDDGVWEIQEYCPLGSLRDWVVDKGGRLGHETLRAVLVEITGALKYLHHLGSGIAHKDLKPANVLVRSEDPLDLVLTDFGTARAQQAFSHITTSIKGTWHYAAPEVYGGHSTAKSDWFSLGVIIYELYAGRKLFSTEDGREVSENDARARAQARNYSTNLIEDPRWKLLLDGLLTWDKDLRWNAEQIESWLNGGTPEVRDNYSATDRNRASIATYQPGFTSAIVTTPQELAYQIRIHWDNAADAFAGRPDEKMLEFLDDFPKAATARQIIGSSDSAGAKMVRLQGILDPDTPVYYEKLPLNDETLRATIEAGGSGDAIALNWLASVLDERILSIYADLAGSPQAAQADYQLWEWRGEVEDVANRVPQGFQAFAREAFRVSLPELYATSLNPTQALQKSLTDCIGEAKRLANTDFSRYPWVSHLSETIRNSDDRSLGLMVAGRAVLTTLAEEERARIINQIEQDFIMLAEDAANRMALFISSDIVLISPYHDKAGSITWEHAHIRKWLNDNYLCKLPAEIRNRIVEVVTQNDNNPDYETPGGHTTSDKVFLLSIDEAQRYFASADLRVARHQEKDSSWWLRSPGYHDNSVAYIGGAGLINTHGSIARRHRYGVRPAFWIDLGI
jgi:serine/threonine protein kinase